jgi:hypothetical protein
MKMYLHAAGIALGSDAGSLFFLFTENGARPLETQAQMLRFASSALSLEASLVLERLGSRKTAGLCLGYEYADGFAVGEAGQKHQFGMLQGGVSRLLLLISCSRGSLHLIMLLFRFSNRDTDFV